jgi:hypothetical protein
LRPDVRIRCEKVNAEFFPDAKWHVNLLGNLGYFLAALGIFGASIAAAQNFVGGVRGLVQDPGGAVIFGATVTLANDATGMSRAATSDATGQ